MRRARPASRARGGGGPGTSSGAPRPGRGRRPAAAVRGGLGPAPPPEGRPLLCRCVPRSSRRERRVGPPSGRRPRGPRPASSPRRPLCTCPGACRGPRCSLHRSRTRYLRLPVRPVQPSTRLSLGSPGSAAVWFGFASKEGLRSVDGIKAQRVQSTEWGRSPRARAPGTRGVSGRVLEASPLALSGHSSCAVLWAALDPASHTGPCVGSVCLCRCSAQLCMRPHAEFAIMQHPRRRAGTLSC